MNKKRLSGFSLIELLMVLFVFSITSIIVARSLALSLKGSAKSESVSVVKENIEYTASTMERLLRNAKSVTCASSDIINYVHENSVAGRFRCVESGLDGFIDSGVASPLRITSTEVDVLCSGSGVVVFSCDAPVQTVPGVVRINLRANHASLGALGEGAQVSVQTSVQLRSY